MIRRLTIDLDTYELFQRGSELLAAGHAHQAVIALERARDAAPGHGSVREALGRAYYGAGRTSAAEAEFSEALEIDPSMELRPEESGHPIWGPVFKRVKACMPNQ